MCAYRGEGANGQEEKSLKRGRKEWNRGREIRACVLAGVAGRGMGLVKTDTCGDERDWETKPLLVTLVTPSAMRAEGQSAEGLGRRSGAVGWVAQPGWPRGQHALTSAGTRAPSLLFAIMLGCLETQP